MTNEEIKASLLCTDFQRIGKKGTFKFKGGKQWVPGEVVQAALLTRFRDVVFSMQDGDNLEVTFTVTPRQEEQE